MQMCLKYAVEEDGRKLCLEVMQIVVYGWGKGVYDVGQGEVNLT